MNERLTTHGLAELLANQPGMDKKKADEFIKALVSYFVQSMEKNKFVKIYGLGTFKIVLVRERKSVHIQSGERFVIPAHHKLTFVPDKDFKEQTNRPLALFEAIETSDREILATQQQTAEPFKERKFIPTGPIVVPYGNTMHLEDEIPISTASMDEIIFNEEVSTYEEEVETQQDELTYEEEAEMIQAEPAYDTGAEPQQEELVFKEGTEPQQEELVYVENSASIEENVGYIAATGKPFFSSKKKKIIVYTLSFLLLLIVVFLGARSATYKFLQSNSNQTNKQSQDMTHVASNTNDDAVYTFDAVQDSLESRANQPTEEVITEPIPVSSNAIVSNTTKEEKTYNDWMAPSPSNNVRTETRRVDQPNKEIEERNRGLTNNARQGAARNVSGTTAENRSTTTSTPAATTSASAAKDTQFPARIKVPAGSTLRQLALENYGDKVFWVYIYEANKSRISNPDQIPIGTELVLPAPGTYGIDAKNKASLEKALQKQRQLSR